MPTRTCFSLLSSFRVVLLWALLAVPALVAAAPAQTPLAAFGVRYLDGLFAAKPHLASFMGDHRFDDRWPDVSPQGLAAREKQVRAQQTELSRLLAGKLSLDERIDGQIMRDALALELLYLTDIREFTWDPRLNDSFPPYDPREIVADRLVGLLQAGQAPGDDRRDARLTALTARLSALPAFLTAMQAQLKRPARIYTERAIADNQGRIQTVDSDVRRFIDSFTAAKDQAARQRALAAQRTALSALRDYQRFLQQTLLPRSDGDWRLGAALIAKKYPLALQTDRVPGDVAARAQARFVGARAELYLVARRLYMQLFPGRVAPAEKPDPREQGRVASVINAVKDELSKDHPPAADLVAAHARYLDGMRRFLEAHDLLSLPPADTLVVQPMPLFKRGVVAAEYLAPDILDRGAAWRATYYVDPIDPTLPRDKQEGLMRANNTYEIELTGLHEAYPGHHTQHFYARKSWNPVRAVLWNGPMEEGWAVYGTTLAVAQGYGDQKNDAYRFFDLLGSLIVAHNAILDVRLQSGTLTDAEAVRLMVEDGFQEQAAAEKKLLRAKMDSTQLSQYFLGLLEIEDLEQDVRQQDQMRGQPFNQRAFNEALIGHGSVAVRYLRRYVLVGDKK